MPVTKKKGAVFAIYTDSPDRTSQPLSKQPTRTSPRRSTNTSRKALTSLQPKSLVPPSSRALSLKQSAVLKHKPQSDAPVKSKSKSTIQIYTDPEPSKPKSSGVIGATAIKRRVPTSTLVASQPLPVPASIKRTRDLLSPLPIFLDSQENEGASCRPTTRSVTGRSPAKRGRTVLSAVESSPAILSSASRRKKEVTMNKENSAPPTLLFDDFEGSPATRTRSKVRNMPFEFSVTLSPLNFRDTPQQRRRTKVEHLLVGNPALGVNATRRDAVEEMIDHGSPTAEKTGGGKPLGGKTRGKGIAVRSDAILADVSEAYGAKGDAPEGFDSQGR
ncbi:hypothetical protein I312_102911 [Cryptococcus bacillisporus CA1280]|uniref:uncharacterized protein n=1 Tax=Cryptococcus bacillisporus CA1280 TaxID=1296109 RepID=UPI003369B85A